MPLRANLGDDLNIMSDPEVISDPDEDDNVAGDQLSSYANILAVPPSKQAQCDDQISSPKIARNASDDATVLSIIILSVSGAGSPACNGDFLYEGSHKGRPLFKSSAGAIVYFHDHWKMNSCYKTTGWIYGVQGAAGPLPPEGPWTSHSPNGDADPTPPTLDIDGEAFAVVSQKGALIKLEGGRTVSKREEGKSWRWGAIGGRGARKAEAPAGIGVPPTAPPGHLRPETSVPESRLEEARPRGPGLEANGGTAGGGAVVGIPSMEALLARIAYDEAAAAVRTFNAPEDVAAADDEVLGVNPDGSAFFELGEPSAASQPPGERHGVVVGRGHEYNFTAIRRFGQQNVDELAGPSGSGGAAGSRGGRQEAPPAAPRLSERLRALKECDSGLIRATKPRERHRGETALGSSVGSYLDRPGATFLPGTS